MRTRGKRLNQSFYLQGAETVAVQLLGKLLVTRTEGKVTSGIIVETEAYCGVNDRASHAFGNRRTRRTETMYKAGGHAYVYLIYGMYSMFNVVTSREGYPDAVLIRAIEPIEGIDVMLKRRKLDEVSPRLTAGPGVLTRALGITTKHDGLFLPDSNIIGVEDVGKIVKPEEVVRTTRVGVDYAGEDALLPRRFYIKNNPYVSKK
ncbi:MAG: DNA-3-methyladenine glycosylase [Chlorobi bacterium]|nr:DNA-3-methyladenine glycosylase [Chlorobiota bacterium]